METSLLLECFSETNEQRNKPTEWCCFAQTHVDNLTIQTYLFLYRKLREENLRTSLSFLTREFKIYDATEATTSLKIVSKLVKENSNSRLCVRVLMQSSCFCSLNYAKFVALSLLSRQQERHKFAYLTVKNNGFARFARAFFSFLDISQTFLFFPRREMTCFADLFCGRLADTEDLQIPASLPWPMPFFIAAVYSWENTLHCVA